MQMFVLDENPYFSAQALADTHVRVICREVSMCLSSWYAKNIGHTDELPYRPFNHPVIDQLSDINTRKNVSDDCAVGCREYKDRDEAQLERELAGIVQASYNGG